MKKTEQYRYALLDEYKKEGGTIKSFCERKGIAEWQYYHWRRQRAKKKQRSEEKGFAKIQLNQNPPPATLRLRMRGGMELSCDNIRVLARLLKELNEQYA